LVFYYDDCCFIVAFARFLQFDYKDNEIRAPRQIISIFLRFAAWKGGIAAVEGPVGRVRALSRRVKTLSRRVRLLRSV